MILKAIDDVSIASLTWALSAETPFPVTRVEGGGGVLGEGGEEEHSEGLEEAPIMYSSAPAESAPPPAWDTVQCSSNDQLLPTLKYCLHISKDYILKWKISFISYNNISKI